jgi:hypothetical protein
VALRQAMREQVEGASERWLNNAHPDEKQAARDSGWAFALSNFIALDYASFCDGIGQEVANADA